MLRSYRILRMLSFGVEKKCRVEEDEDCSDDECA